MVKTIGDACNIRTGKLDANRAVKDGDYPFFTCAEFPEKIDHYAFDGDVVLIAGNNARGNFHVSRYQGKFNAYQRTYVLTAKPGYDIDYIYYALKLELQRLREKAQGSQT
ncbi:restriction endonuclease subunit S, partial [Salmonella enterica]|nr:restriction endonuclease subunit S [Salmonella enterica]